jgi:hypothetical protein
VLKNKNLSNNRDKFKQTDADPKSLKNVKNLDFVKRNYIHQNVLVRGSKNL